ncbi:MAG: 1,4-dihydroxy-6-naphthoate synthase [Candidatus Delongbacteria bacterium]|nr:1,4-dihydroxy-6-naphthoate synthase [Candidatus Delongbacteria bacterium]MBN2836120.1 1,4-dihydroxy-6-naphthoate synthase [Candidatus Delongbacteria bacterium]
MFDGFINRNRNLDLEVSYKDISNLNEDLYQIKHDISKISFPALFENLENYEMLNSGAALGYNCGPLIVSKNKLTDFRNLKIAIPGFKTSAFLLFTHFFGVECDFKETLFSEIMNDVKTGKVDAGLIIHESRFTYQNFGLIKCYDLGELWEQQTRLPLPLGAIAIKRDFDCDFKLKIESLLSDSISSAMKNNSVVNFDYIKSHATEYDENVMKSHIDLYVNKFSINLGHEGKMAIKMLFEVARKSGMLNIMDFTGNIILEE